MYLEHFLTKNNAEMELSLQNCVDLCAFVVMKSKILCQRVKNESGVWARLDLVRDLDLVGPRFWSRSHQIQAHSPHKTGSGIW